MSVASNVLMQVNAKLGCPLWEVLISHPDLKGKRVATGGIATYHKLINKDGESCASLVGSLNSKITKYINCPRKMRQN